MNVIDIGIKWFRNFRRLELSRINLSHGSQNWFESSRVLRNRGGEIIEFERCKLKFNGNEVWFEISGGSGNGGLVKSGFHCIHVAQLVV